MIETNGEQVVRDFLRQDGNKDGMLNKNGLKAAILKAEYNLGREDPDEIFSLL